MTGLFSDVRVSIRHLRKTPGFTAAAVLVLALGIGLNAAMFGLSYTMAFAPSPFERPEEIVQLYSHARSEPDTYRGFSYGAFSEIAAREDVFAGVLAQRTVVAGVNEQPQGGQPRRAISALISADYFKVLGVPLALGRVFTDLESQPGAETPVAIASHALWKRTGFDPEFLGGTVRVNERPFTVVGITPEGFMGTSSLFGPEIFLPLGVFDSIEPGSGSETPRSLQEADSFPLLLSARLKSGTTVDASAPGLRLVAAAVERAYPTEYRGQEFLARPLPRFVSSNYPAQEGAVVTLAVAVLGMTGSVLLIVCLNLASLFLARGQARRREFAIRLAIGGGRARIVRQLITEGLILSFAGGALGSVLGLYAIDAMVAILLERLPVSLVLDFGASPLVVLGTALLSVAATMIFAFGPALRHSGEGVLADLKQQSGDEARPRAAWFLPRNPLVSAQIALSLSLLISAGLFIQMARQANASDLGFDADRTVAIEVDAGLAGYREAQGVNLYAGLEERLRSLPGVRSASVAATIPFGVRSEGRLVRKALAPAGDKGEGARWNAVGASYFETMGLPIHRGRAFTDAEAQRVGASRVVIINDVLARRLWSDGDALGRSVEFEATGAAPARSGPMVVVGIVPAVREDPFDTGQANAVYVPFAQDYRGAAFFHVRPRSLASEALVQAVEREVKTAAPGLPSFKATTFEAHVSQSLEFWGLRVASNLFAALGALASLIAIVGIYGSLSYAVSRRTREIGVRLAIGASPRVVRRMVMGEGLALGGAGVAFGLLLGLGMGRVMDSIFVDVGAFDALTFTIAPLLLLAATAAAAWVPAHRATTVNPVTALRAD